MKQYARVNATENELDNIDEIKIFNFSKITDTNRNFNTKRSQHFLETHLTLTQSQIKVIPV